jgi:hypothetical protein
MIQFFYWGLRKPKEEPYNESTGQKEFYLRKYDYKTGKVYKQIDLMLTILKELRFK